MPTVWDGDALRVYIGFELLDAEAKSLFLRDAVGEGVGSESQSYSRYITLAFPPFLWPLGGS